MMEGWQCPKCGRVNAPWVSMCPCYYENQKVTCTTTTVPDYKINYAYGPSSVCCSIKKDEEDK